MTPLPTIALDHLGDREAAALLRKGRLEDLIVDPDLPRPGTIYRAVADRPVKGLGGMFLKTPEDQAFLRQTAGLAPGQSVLVQVTGHAEPGKAVPVTRKLTFKSRHVIVTPDAPGLNISRQIRDDDRRDALQVLAREAGVTGDMGLILRSSCLTADDDEILSDLRTMLDLATAITTDEGVEAPDKLLDGDGPHDLAWREWSEAADIVTDAGCFDLLGVSEQIEALRDPRVDLADATLWIEPTRALVSVDVNTQGNTSPAAGLRANLATARELPRQLRLRGLGGQIVIDPAPMPHKDRRQFETALRAALKSDPVDTSLVGWTKMGLFEVHRKRERVPLAEIPIPRD